MMQPPVPGRAITPMRGMPLLQGGRRCLVDQQDERNQRQDAETDQDIGNIADGLCNVSRDAVPRMLCSVLMN
jgi:hypothetical protein